MVQIQVVTEFVHERATLLGSGEPALTKRPVGDNEVPTRDAPRQTRRIRGVALVAVGVDGVVEDFGASGLEVRLLQGVELAPVVGRRTEDRIMWQNVRPGPRSPLGSRAWIHRRVGTCIDVQTNRAARCGREGLDHVIECALHRAEVFPALTNDGNLSHRTQADRRQDHGVDLDEYVFDGRVCAHRLQVEFDDAVVVDVDTVGLPGIGNRVAVSVVA